MDSLKEIENKLWYNNLLMKSLEAKTERIEPFSIEFEETMQSLFKLKEEQNRLAGERLLARQREIKLYEN